MRNLKKEPKQYIVLQNENFAWDQEAIMKFREMWNKDIDFFQICRTLKRKQIEVALLMMDQEQEGHIKKRKIGLGLRGYRY